MRLKENVLRCIIKACILIHQMGSVGKNFALQSGNGYVSCGPEALKHKAQNKVWSPEDKYALVVRVLSGESNKSVALTSGINEGMLYQWVRKYKIYGYNGLISKPKGRKSKDPDMKKIGTREPKKLNESEYEELIRLRAEITYIKAENEVIKKEIALREEKEAVRLKAKKQQSSKNSVKKDTH